MAYEVTRHTADWPSDCIAIWVFEDGTAFPRTEIRTPSLERTSIDQAIENAEIWLSQEPATYTQIIIHLDNGAELPHHLK